MASLPTARPAVPAAARPPRQQRGYVTSYGVGRVCAEAACLTELSRYNKAELCYPHADQLAARLRRGRS